VTITIGGNDAGFSNVITQCAQPAWISNCNGAIDGAQSYSTCCAPPPRRASRQPGSNFRFSDAIAPFVGHAVCSSSARVNGLSNPLGESYHPNRAGHADGYAPLVRGVMG
jgi:hypothetical protein